MQHGCCNSFSKGLLGHCGVPPLLFGIYDPVMLKLSIGINIQTKTLSDVAPSLDSMFQFINFKPARPVIGGTQERSPIALEAA